MAHLSDDGGFGEVSTHINSTNRTTSASPTPSTPGIPTNNPNPSASPGANPTNNSTNASTLNQGNAFNTPTTTPTTPPRITKVIRTGPILNTSSANTPSTNTSTPPTFPATDRRACRRTRVHGDALIAFDTASTTQNPATTNDDTPPRRVSFIDASVTGIGIRSDEPVAIGSRFALFPDKVRKSSWTGHVVRCVENEGAWTIGLHLAAAAA